MENEKQKFDAYLAVRDSGATNMFAVNKVCELSDGILNKEDCLFIMEHFNGLCDKYAEGNCQECGQPLNNANGDLCVQCKAAKLEE